ncbi:MAG: N-acetylmuramoyl-L-alanine amidase [Polyangiaceae bacterium]
MKTLRSQKKPLLLTAALALAAAGGAAAWLLARPAPIWPDDAFQLHAPTVGEAPASTTAKIYLDAGHGAKGNTGNRSSLCQDEQDFTLSLAEQIAPRLRSRHGFEVTISRRAGELVDYRSRVAAAEAWGADAFVSLHSDIRGSAETTEPCPTSRAAPGFSVLWSDVGPEPLNRRRLDLARATARALARLGLPAYHGHDYAGLYDPDAGGEEGVFVDRHEPEKRIFVLWKPAIPSIIIETHNALDDREARRWNDDETRLAFADALGLALAEVLSTRSAHAPHTTLR